MVILRRDPASGLLVPYEGGPPADLSAGSEALSRELREALRACLLPVESGAEIPAVVTDTLLRAQVPPLFRGSPWLEEARPLIFTDGLTEVAGVRLRYQMQQGLWAPDEGNG